MRKVLNGWKGSVIIGGRKISNIRFADDTMLMARNKYEMVELLRRNIIDSVQPPGSRDR